MGIALWVEGFPSWILDLEARIFARKDISWTFAKLQFLAELVVEGIWTGIVVFSGHKILNLFVGEIWMIMVFLSIFQEVYLSQIQLSKQWPLHVGLACQTTPHSLSFVSVNGKYILNCQSTSGHRVWIQGFVNRIYYFWYTVKNWLEFLHLGMWIQWKWFC